LSVDLSCWRFSGGSSNSGSGKTSADVNDGRWALGPKTAKVTLVEFGDIQCPACGAMEPAVEQIRRDYVDTGKVRFVFRNFPLTTVHQFALQGADAVEAAGMQGKYWEMHDQLYATQQQWSVLSNPDNFFAQTAHQVGVPDIAKWKSDYKSSAVSKLINQDEQYALSLGLDQTPTFYLNGQQVTTPPASYSDLANLINSKLGAQ
jgi:protein-disulfide isomerase